MSESRLNNLDDNLNSFSNDIKLVNAAHKYRAFQILQRYKKTNFIKHCKVNTLEKSIINRLNLSNLSTVDKYLDFLETSDEEKNSLYNYLIPPTKQFFSDGISWESLANNVIPQLLLKVPVEKVIRCWVVGCGTGEEAYSLAMLLDEAISATVPWRRFKILATDINNSALKIASKGVYSSKIAKNISPERLKQYFALQNNAFTVSRELQETIVFAPHNIFQDIGFYKINLICCQNFLIYIQPQYRERVLSTLNNSLTFDGILFLDNCELLLKSYQNFIRLQYPGVFFKKQKQINSIIQKSDRSISYLDLFQSRIYEASLSQARLDLDKESPHPFGLKSSPYQNIDLTRVTSLFQDLELELERDRENLQDAIEELRLKQIGIEKINEELITVNKNAKAINQKYQLQLETVKELNTDLENLLRSVDIGVIFLDPQLKVRKYNSSAQKIFNFIPLDIGRSIKDLKHNLDFNLVEVLEQFFQTQRSYELEVKNLLTEEFLLMKLHCYFSKSQQSSFSTESCIPSCEGVILTFVDISSRKQAEKILTHQAFYDSLTKLPNRLLFKEQLQHAVARLPRQEAPFLAVLYLDLDGFKQVNDSLGHSAGDLLLIETARRLNKVSRSNDIVSRLGGDEFVILLEEIDRPEQTLEICSRIHKILSMPFQIEDRQVNISSSIGVAIHSYQNNLNAKIETLIENADMAMYRAKQKGIAQTEIFVPQMRAELEAVTEMKDRLDRAFEEGEFLLYYQPIFCLKHGKIKGFEALLRWNHSELGLTSPEYFLPIVQNSALFFKLEFWIIRQACYQLKQWLQKFELGEYFSLNINISPQLLSHVNFLTYINDLLDKEEKIAKHLTIEITETALIDNTEAVEAILQQLRLKKIKIALDDFGTGFSSLSHLHSFSLDIIKIDRSFIASLGHNRRSAHILRGIIYMSQQLDLTIVAEGIESLNQLQWLQESNCQLGQGYFWSPSISTAAATELLSSYRIK